MAKYLIVIQKAENNYAAYSPDVLGCITTGRSIEETLDLMTEALEFHFEGMLDAGEPIPQPRGLDSILQAQQDTEGEDYLLAYVDQDTVLPNSTQVQPA